MMIKDMGRMFHGISYSKTASEIKAAAEYKVTKLEAKIAERQKRVTAIREEHGIDDKALIQLLTAARKQSQAMNFTYSTSMVMNNRPGAARGEGGQEQMEERTIGAGVVNNLLTENDFIESEKDQVEQLQLMLRNLRARPRMASDHDKYPEEQFTMSEDDLRYLGF